MKTTIERLKGQVETRGFTIDTNRVFNLLETVCVYCCMQGPGGCHAPDKGPPPL